VSSIAQAHQSLLFVLPNTTPLSRHSSNTSQGVMLLHDICSVYEGQDKHA
jgi:hypothetical protein